MKENSKPVVAAPSLLSLLFLCGASPSSSLSVSFIKLNQFFLSESSLAPSLFNNPPRFNEFCYVHRGQRLGANL